MSPGRPFRWDRWRPAQFLLYLLLRVLLMTAGMFSPAATPSLTRLIAAGWWRVDRRRRRVAEWNLARTGLPNAPGILRRIYEHFARCAVEIARLPRILSRRDGLSRWVRLERLEILDQSLSHGKGVILLGAHLGNWELSGLAIAAAGYRLNFVVRPVANPYVDRWVRNSRGKAGRLIRKYRALPAMTDVVRRNEILFLLADQHARLKGEWVDFFGIPASTTRSPALLSLRTGAPILPLNLYREGGTHFVVVGDPIDPGSFRGRPNAVHALTQAFTTELERYVRMHPEQWNWLHRRWRTPDSPGSPPRVARPDRGSISESSESEERVGRLGRHQSGRSPN